MPPNDVVPDAPARRAVELLDIILAERPEKNGERFSELTRCLCAYRDALIRRDGHADASEAERERLARVNSVISVIVGGHYPLGPIPWGEIEQTRPVMQDLAAAETRSA